MPYLKGNSPYYKIQLTLPGYGRTPCLSTQTTRRSRAVEMEQLVRFLADHEYYDILDALRPTGPGSPGRIALAELLRAKKEGRLDQLRRRLSDPPLEEAVRAFAELVSYANHRYGLRHVLRLTVDPDGARLAPPGARLSWLREPRNINRVTQTMIGEGYAPRTVGNGVWGGLSKLLQHEYGRADARAILAEAKRPHENDARDIWLSADDVHRVVSACEWEVRMFLVLMATTGIDVGPALRVRVRDFSAERWTLYVRDTKTATRPRTIDLSPVGTYALLLLTEGKAPGAKAFTLSQGQINYRWRKARRAARLRQEDGFPGTVRMKDLRHTFAVHYLQAGGNIAGLAGRMGHVRQAQSLAYAKHEAHGTRDMAAAASSMGLALPDHLAAELDRPEQAPEQGAEVPAWWFDPGAPPQVDGEDVPETQTYTRRGTAGYAEDPLAYFRRRREERRAG